MNDNYIICIHYGTRFLPNDYVGGYFVFDVRQDKRVAVFYFNPLSQADAFYKAEALAYELNESERKIKMREPRKEGK